MMNSTKSLNHSGWECKHYDSPDFKIQGTARIVSLFLGMRRIDHLAMPRFQFGYIHSLKSLYLLEKKILLLLK